MYEGSPWWGDFVNKIEGCSMLGQGQMPPNFGLGRQMWHETPFDELKAWSYRCKKERSVAFKIRQNAFPARAPAQTLLGKVTTLPRTRIRLGRGHSSTYASPLGASLDLLGALPLIFFCVKPPLEKYTVSENWRSDEWWLRWAWGQWTDRCKNQRIWQNFCNKLYYNSN